MQAISTRSRPQDPAFWPGSLKSGIPNDSCANALDDTDHAVLPLRSHSPDGGLLGRTDLKLMQLQV